MILAQQRAIDYATKKGAIVITSAGNGATSADGNRSLISIPAELNNVVAVSATAPYKWYYDFMTGVLNPNLDIPASYTDYGMSLVDIAAPGGDDEFYFLNKEKGKYDKVLSTFNGGWAWASGTSMACAHVSGVAALIIGKNGGRMNPKAVKKQLLKTADKIDGKGNSLYFGRGRVNAYRAVTE